MKTIIHKNLISRKSRKREICIEETIQENGCLSKSVKRSLYFIRNICAIRCQEDFENWMKAKAENSDADKKDFHIMKIHSDKTKSDTVLCKAKGAFYVVVGKDILNIVFLHYLRMEISAIDERRKG